METCLGMIGNRQPVGDFKPFARELYTKLLGPAQSEVNRAKRLLICPDKALYQLPFSALIQPQSGRYLIESKPLHIVVSMSVYAQLRAMKARPNGTVLALGDPQYPPLQSASVSTVDVSPPTVMASAETRRQVTLMGGGGGGALPPLPYTRDQVLRIGQIYGAQARIHLGKEATTSVVKRDGPQARILHLACHGLLDNTDPLASALALTPENAQDDGMLRGYDVMKLKLHADLVVLSACETGRGKETRSEGIAGMTRAFEYAGARSVLVSLWDVEDRRTAQLMEVFYQALKHGAKKDEALRSAQLSLLRNEPDSRPFYWAAFQLNGDWR